MRRGRLRGRRRGRISRSVAAPARILFLGRLADLAGERERAWPLAGTLSVAELIEALAAEEPALAAALSHASVRVAVNQSIASGAGARVSAGDEIAFLPPVSGG